MKLLIAGIILATVVEVAGLTKWLSEVDTGSAILGVGILLAGFIIELIIASKVRVGAADITKIVIAASFETITWVGWLAAASVNPILAAGILVLGLQIGHAIETNMLEGRGLLEGFREAVKRGRVTATTLIESATGIIWLQVARGNASEASSLAAAVLIIGIGIEHLVAARRIG